MIELNSMEMRATEKDRAADELHLAAPFEEGVENFRDFCAECWDSIHDRYLLKDPQQFEKWRTTLIPEYEAAARGEGLPHGWIPSATYWICKGLCIVGLVNFRLGLSPRLSEYGGHFGFVIRPSMRRRGCLRNIFPALLAKARELGIRTVLLTCTEDNTPSLNFLLSTSFSRQEKGRAEIDGTARPVRRFFYDPPENRRSGIAKE